MAKKILLIEDEKILAEMYKVRLEKEGFEVKRTIDAKAGLLIAKKEKPDLILLDVLLPGISGLEALKILKEDSKTKDISVVVFSNYDTPDVRRTVAKYKTRYILKSDVVTRDLVKAVKEEI